MAAWPNSAGVIIRASAMATTNCTLSEATRAAASQRAPVTAASRSPSEGDRPGFRSWSAAEAPAAGDGLPLADPRRDLHARAGRRPRRAHRPLIGHECRLKLVPDPWATAPRDVVMILGYTSWGGSHPPRARASGGSAHGGAPAFAPGGAAARLQSLPLGAGAKLLRAAVGPRDADFPAATTRRLHEPLRLRRADPTDVRGVARACAAYERSVKRAVERFGLRRPVVITTHPLLAGFGASTGPAPSPTTPTTTFAPIRR